jgi:hypothetical protein
MVAFLQVTGRICEALTQCDWMLSFQGQLVVILDLELSEGQALVSQIEQSARYTPVTVPHQMSLGFANYFTIPLVLWADTKTGRADMYSPDAGLIEGQQLLHPRVPSRVGSTFSTITTITGYGPGTAEAGTDVQAITQSLLESFGAMTGEPDRIDEFLSSSSAQGDCYGGSIDAYQPDPYDP